MHFDYVGIYIMYCNKYLRFFYVLFGCKVVVINKDRCKKKQLVHRKTKSLNLWKTSLRDIKMLIEFGICTRRFVCFSFDKGKLPSKVLTITSEKLTDTWIGVAPFANIECITLAF